MKRKSGYTLMELIVVLAIIGILTAILVPTWTYMVVNGKVRAANANAKAIFGVAQTAATERRAYERVYTGTADAYMTSGDFFFYWDGQTGIKCDADGNAIADATATQNAEFTQKINKMIDNSTIYKIYIHDYQVQSVVTARFDGDKYIGAYPVSVEEADNNSVFAAKGVTASFEKSKNVVGIDMTCFTVN